MYSKMIKKIEIVFIILLTFVIIGCSIDSGNEGVLPKEEFTLLEYYSDNMVFQQNEDFKIIGKSEEGVVLKASLYNEKDELIVKSESMADVNGDFSIVMKGQKGSYKSHYLEITDGLNTEKIENVTFGDVWIFAGEQEYHTHSIKYEEDYDFSNISFIRYIAGKLVWSEYKESDHIYSLVKSIAVALKEKVNVPIAFVDASLYEGYADAWISYETATKHKNISKYLTEIERLDEEKTEDKNTNKLGSMYETYFNNLNGYKIKGIIWSQGLTDFKNFDESNKNVFISDYVYLLIQLFNDVMDLFENKVDIYCIQESYCDKEYAADLRNAQAIPTYQIKDIHLIPTYDTFELIKDENSEEQEEVLPIDVEIQEEIYEFSIKKYLERIIELIYNGSYSKNAIDISTSFTNFMVDNYQIKISFDSSYILENVEELYGLEIVSSDGKTIPYEFTIDKNNLSITLIFEEDEIIEDLTYTIYYGYVIDVYKCNLKTSNGMPIVPFKINISE